MAVRRVTPAAAPPAEAQKQLGAAQETGVETIAEKPGRGGSPEQMAAIRAMRTPETRAAAAAVTEAVNSTAKHLDKKTEPLITLKQWTTFLDDVAAGLSTGDALEKNSIKELHFRRIIHTEAELMNAWQGSRKAARWIGWTQDMLDDIFQQIMAGVTTTKACRDHGKESRDLYLLCLVEGRIKDEYDQARKIQAENFIDENLDEAAEDGNDLTAEGKGNAAAVQRSRLRVETRQWIMSKMHADRFAQVKRVDHSGRVEVDHVARLEQGRKRVEVLRKGVASQKTVRNAQGFTDAEFSEHEPT